MKTTIGAVLLLLGWAGPAIVAPAASAAVNGAAVHGAAVHGAAGTAAKRPVAYDCDGWHRGRTRVPQVDISCDGSVVVTVTGWKYWSAVSARSARGQLWVDTCRPNCAAGHYRTYPATVVFYRARSHDGVRYFTRLRLQYSHGLLRDYLYRWATYPGASVPVWIGGPRLPAG
jgi:hypothetical protein